MGHPLLGTHSLVWKSIGSNGRQFPPQTCIVPPNWRMRISRSSPAFRPVCEPILRSWALREGFSSPLSAIETLTPERIRNRPICKPTGPAPTMHTSLSIIEPPGRESAWIIIPLSPLEIHCSNKLSNMSIREKPRTHYTKILGISRARRMFCIFLVETNNSEGVVA